MTQPLFSGLKVIDCASYVAGPAAATVLADFGADVIKLEPTGEGDPWRTQYKRHGMPPSEINHPWLMDSRNKRALALDLKSSAGRAVLDRLVSQSDVFITNVPLPARGRLGIRYSDFTGYLSAADLRLAHGVRRGGRGSRQDRIRCHGVLGAVRADG